MMQTIALLVTLGLASLTAAQESSLQLPSCESRCYKQTAEMKGCGEKDYACTCHGFKDEFYPQYSSCLIEGCAFNSAGICAFFLSPLSLPPPSSLSASHRFRFVLCGEMGNERLRQWGNHAESLVANALPTRTNKTAQEELESMVCSLAGQSPSPSSSSSSPTPKPSSDGSSVPEPSSSKPTAASTSPGVDGSPSSSTSVSTSVVSNPVPVPPGGDPSIPGAVSEFSLALNFPLSFIGWVDVLVLYLCGVKNGIGLEPPLVGGEAVFFGFFLEKEDVMLTFCGETRRDRFTGTDAG